MLSPHILARFFGLRPRLNSLTDRKWQWRHAQRLAFASPRRTAQCGASGNQTPAATNRWECRAAYNEAFSASVVPQVRSVGADGEHYDNHGTNRLGATPRSAIFGNPFASSC